MDRYRWNFFVHSFTTEQMNGKSSIIVSVLLPACCHSGRPGAPAPYHRLSVFDLPEANRGDDLVHRDWVPFIYYMPAYMTWCSVMSVGPGVARRWPAKCVGVGEDVDRRTCAPFART